MVSAEYNPFNRKYYKETEHGIINKIERRYFTHREPQHVFKKYRAFAISTTEIEICWQEHIDHIIIKYHGKKENIIYKIELDKLKYLHRYQNLDDEQIIIPIKELTIIGKEEKDNEI